MKKKMNAVLVEEKAFNVYKETPISVVDIKHGEIYPVKYEYKERGYKGMIFSEQLSNVKFESKGIK